MEPPEQAIKRLKKNFTCKCSELDGPQQLGLAQAVEPAEELLEQLLGLRSPRELARRT